ncbi:MAG: thiamine-phosphate kinase [Cyanobacteriota bacterium]|nr:thiamine-phosphate kinase [Cyanobacteriota bacterium]
MSARHLQGDRVRDLGERGLLARVRRFCASQVIGDDGAEIPFAPARSLVVTTDMSIDGVHFSDRTTTAADAGWRTVAANLSDLAAMGAVPLGITVGLGLPGDTPVAWVEELYGGMKACLDPFQTEIVGGDICRSPVKTLSITAFGRVEPNRTIRRSQARVGDAIVVSGSHGLSRGGLELLLNPDIGLNLSQLDRTTLIRAHQRPRPRLDVLPVLWEILGETTRIAGMDSSDGLADAVLQICRESGVGATLDTILLPRALTQLVPPEKALDWVLYGGEDFELVLCLPLPSAMALVAQLGGEAAIVGTITQGETVRIVDPNNPDVDRVLSLEEGFQHFRS